MMAKSVINDKRSVTAKNLEHIKDVTGLDNSNLTANDVRNYSGVTPVPINQEWRLSLLPKMLSQRNKMESNFEDTKTLTIMIDSLCTS